MSRHESGEYDETLPSQIDVRTAWGNWVESNPAERPNTAETGESRTVSDLQDGWPAVDSVVSDDAVGNCPLDGIEPAEAVIYSRQSGGVSDTAANDSREEQRAAWRGEVAIQSAQAQDARTVIAESANAQIGDHLGGLPVEDDDIADRTSENRINLADDVPNVLQKPTYGGYLDVVMHGSATNTEAHVGGEVFAFTIDETAQLIEAAPGWDNRPVRLLSCSTGQGDYAQELADRLNVPVYAPSDVLWVLSDGSSEIEDGQWRRFEPRDRPQR